MASPLFQQVGQYPNWFNAVQTNDLNTRSFRSAEDLGTWRSVFKEAKSDLQLAFEDYYWERQLVTGTSANPTLSNDSYIEFAEDARSLDRYNPINAKGGAGNDWIVGNDHDNLLNGDDVLQPGMSDSSPDGMPWASQGKDALYGLGGFDVIHGGGNDDYLDGGAGDDILHGGGGNDILVGGSGWDKMIGYDGNDLLIDFNGAVMDGRQGKDTYYISKDGNREIWASDGDRVFIQGTASEIAARTYTYRSQDTFQHGRSVYEARNRITRITIADSNTGGVFASVFVPYGTHVTADSAGFLFSQGANPSTTTFSHSEGVIENSWGLA